jgi:hypothetical protein
MLASPMGNCGTGYIILGVRARVLLLHLGACPITAVC